MKKQVCIVLIILAIQVIAATAQAETYADWMDQGGDLQQTASSGGKKLVEAILFIGAILAAISASVGLAQWSGWIGHQDREKGASRIRNGLIGIALAGTFLLVITFATRLFRG